MMHLAPGNNIVFETFWLDNATYGIDNFQNRETLHSKQHTCQTRKFVKLQLTATQMWDCWCQMLTENWQPKVVFVFLVIFTMYTCKQYSFSNIETHSLSMPVQDKALSIALPTYDFVQAPSQIFSCHAMHHNVKYSLVQFIVFSHEKLVVSYFSSLLLLQQNLVKTIASVNFFQDFLEKSWGKYGVFPESGKIKSLEGSLPPFSFNIPLIKIQAAKQQDSMEYEKWYCQCYFSPPWTRESGKLVFLRLTGKLYIYIPSLGALLLQLHNSLSFLHLQCKFWKESWSVSLWAWSFPNSLGYLNGPTLTEPTQQRTCLPSWLLIHLCTIGR